MLTQSYLRKTFHYNPWTGHLTRRATGARAGYKSTGEYRQIEIKGEQHSEHRVIWFYMTGKWPSGEIDHDNRAKDDNKWANLDDVSTTVNRRNRSLQQNNRSGHAGVRFNTRLGKWQARINLEGRAFHLGSFDKFEHAVAARQEAEILNGFHISHGRNVA